MKDLEAFIYKRRAERMLARFGLNSMTSEPIMRERSKLDEHKVHFTLIERQELLVLNTRFQERGGEDR